MTVNDRDLAWQYAQSKSDAELAEEDGSCIKSNVWQTDAPHQDKVSARRRAAIVAGAVCGPCQGRAPSKNGVKPRLLCPESKPRRTGVGAFTLIELLVVIAIVGILAALLLPVLGRTKERGRQTACLNNLKQVNLALRLYADDYSDSLPVLPDPNPYPNGVGAFYKQLVKAYLGLTGPASPAEKVFICPSDRILSTQIGHAFTSYTFNGYEVGPGSISRITGKRLSSIKRPTQAVVVGEWPAFFGGSWHPVVSQDYPNAKNVLSFVDGHAGPTKIYWDGVSDSDPCNYEPPAGYDYSWDGE